MVAITAHLQANPDDERAHYALGISFDLLDEHAAAQTIYSDGLAIAPESPALRNNLALSLALSGQHEAALAPLQEASSADRASAVFTGQSQTTLAVTRAPSLNAPAIPLDPASCNYIRRPTAELTLSGRRRLRSGAQIGVPRQTLSVSSLPSRLRGCRVIASSSRTC